MDVSVSASLTMPPGWASNFGAGSWQVIRESLHADTQTLTDMEYGNIMARTPEDTGALKSDLTGEPHPDPSDDTLSRIYYGTANQLATWGRVYMLYQEGGDLGLSTYTNDPRLMIASALTDDIADIKAWALTVLNAALNKIALGVP